jgi:hypothetical protein
MIKWIRRFFCGCDRQKCEFDKELMMWKCTCEKCGAVVFFDFFDAD